MAFGAFAFDEAVGQEHLFFGVEKLLDDAAFDFAVGFQRAVNVLGKLFVFRGMGTVIIVVADEKAGEVDKVLPLLESRLVLQRFGLSEEDVPLLHETVAG